MPAPTIERTPAPLSAMSIKHWRSFGPAEWGHVRDGLFGLVLGSLLPIGLFYVALRFWAFSLAVIVVLLWSGLVFVWHRRHTGAIDVFSATTFGLACIKATAGLASQNLDLYLRWPSLENMIYGTAFLGSALFGAPLLALYAQRLYPIPAGVRATDTFKRAFVVASLAWFCGHTLRAVLRLYLVATLPLELYLVTDTVAGWPISLALIAFTTWYPLRQLRRAGLVGAQATPIAAIDTVELVVEEAAPGTV